MTNNQLTEAEITETLDAATSGYPLTASAEANLRRVFAELQERRKAEMGSKPVAWLAIYHGEVYDEAIGITRSVVEAQADRFGWESALTEIIPLYRHAQPAPEKYNIGDATMRHIFTPTGMTNISDLQAVFDRVEVVLSSMESEHVVTITDAMAYAFHHALTDGPLGDEDVEDIKTGLRSALANVSTNQLVLVVPDRFMFEKWWETQNGSPLDGWDSLRTTDGYCDDVIDGQFEAWLACRAAMLQSEPVTTANKLGSSPAQSPIDHGYQKGCECSGCKTTVRICAELAGWIPVSERMPGRYYVLAADFSGRYYPPSQPNTQVGIHDDWFGDGKPTWDDGDGNDLHLKQVTHWMPLPAAPQEVQGE